MVGMDIAASLDKGFWNVHSDRKFIGPMDGEDYQEKVLFGVIVREAPEEQLRSSEEILNAFSFVHRALYNTAAFCYSSRPVVIWRSNFGHRQNTSLMDGIILRIQLSFLHGILHIEG